MLFAGQVPSLFDIEHLGVVVMDGANGAPLHTPLSNSGGSVPRVEPGRGTLGNERTFEN